MFSRCSYKGIPHVHSNHINRFFLCQSKEFVIGLKAFLAIIISDKFNRCTLMINYQCLEFMALCKRFLVDTNSFWNTMYFTNQSSFNGSCNTAMRLVSAQCRQSRNSRNGTFFSQIEKATFKGKCHMTVGLTKFRNNLLNAMRRTVDPWEPNVNKCPHLAGTQMFENSFRGMIIHAKEFITYRTRNANRVVVFNK